MVEPEPQPLLRAFDYVYLTAPLAFGTRSRKPAPSRCCAESLL